MVYAAKRSKNRCPTHPGALLRDDIIPATGRTKAEIAGLLGISRQHLYDILGERKPVSPAIAVRLGKLFGDGAGIWTRMQGAYDTWHAERTEDVSHIPTIKAKAAADLPLRTALVSLRISTVKPAPIRGFSDPQNHATRLPYQPRDFP